MNMTGHGLHDRPRSRKELISWHVLSRPGRARGETSWGTARGTESPDPQPHPDRPRTHVLQQRS